MTRTDAIKHLQTTLGTKYAVNMIAAEDPSVEDDMIEVKERVTGKEWGIQFCEIGGYGVNEYGYETPGDLGSFYSKDICMCVTLGAATRTLIEAVNGRTSF